VVQFETMQLPEEPTYTAPDGSLIRELPRMEHGSFAHCELPSGKVSQAVVHKTVEEIWYFVQGEGEVWRKQGDREEVIQVQPQLALTIPLGTHFQFRNTGSEPLCFLISTMPPWPKDHEEAIPVENHWPSA
jgi:mannose-6-phosphate isomerase-like protein (cupin superfamily)